ncbi:hypothetical protein [Fimbriiglobus ruber]|uniref:Uncharacterized protein n=1 Tax=Fimbriiglobus ruber TaxID=1908690 RepID=A0A225D2D3_9BACT|nr:hypothetical protein [Fimbriiglobus ruber]OWK35682.1 hypothetical protein FRUB_08245 [Fimbriiglobus ruber]
MTIDDFAVDERTGQATAGPAGRIPLQTVYDRDACDGWRDVFVPIVASD